MNYRVISGALGLVFVSLSVFFAVSLLVGFCMDYQKELPFITPWLWAMGVCIGFSIISFYCSWNGGTYIFRKEGICIVSLAWVFVILMGTLPYYLVLDKVVFVDCLFESTSGFTTTGLSVFSDFSQWPYSLVFWRSFSQWIGGVGILIVFVGLFAFLGIGSKVVYESESGGRSSQIDATHIKEGVWKVLLIYLGLSGLNAFCYYLCGLNGFEAICLMFGTLPTGGFSVGGSNLVKWNNSSLECVTIIFMLIGGSSFCLWFKNVKSILYNVEFRFYMMIVVSFSFFIILIFWNQNIDTNLGAVRHTLFQLVSFLTTTGFSTYNYDIWPLSAKLILILAMMIGGCSGSTAGGFKIVRILLLFKILSLSLLKSFRPKLVKPIVLNGEIIDRSIQEKTMQYAVFWILVVSCSILFVSFFDKNISFLGILSGVITSLSNAGCAMAELGPLGDCSILSAPSKYCLSFVMLTGRLEFFALFVLFLPSLWRKY